VFENRVLRRIILPEREDVTGGWRKLHHEGLHKLYSSHNVIGVIRSSRMRWVGHVAYMGDMRNTYKILVRKLKGKDHLGGRGISGRIILKWILKE
jgi:hypothetical protein